MHSRKSIFSKGIVFIISVFAMAIFSFIKVEAACEVIFNDDSQYLTIGGKQDEWQDKGIKLSSDCGGSNLTINSLNVNGKNVGTGEVAGKVKAVESLGKTIAVVLNDRIDFFDIGGKYLDSYYIRGDFKDVELFSNGNLVCIQTIDEVSVLRVR